MPGEASKVIRQVRRAVLLREGGERTDGQLLDSFLRCQDEAALETLVRRHGPMVWGVCRRVLRGHHDAEDAFQATFLVLVRRASSIASPELLGNWLYGVAHQTALKARAALARRRVRERPAAETVEPATSPQPDDEATALLDLHLSRLPEKYRAVIVLCDLEGKGRKEVARQLGLPEGTVASRLARARDMLARRLAYSPSGGPAECVLAAALAPGAAGRVPRSVMSSAVRWAAVAGRPASEMIPPGVVALTERVLNVMLVKKLKVAALVLITAGVLTLSAGPLLFATAGGYAGDETEKASRPAESARAAKRPTVQVRLSGPAGMTLCVLEAGQRGTAIETPCRVNLEPGKVYRLKLADVPNRAGLVRYPTIEIPSPDRATKPFLSNSAVPVQFTEEDFDHVRDGSLVTKVVYLESRKKDRKAAKKGEPLVMASYQLEPEGDPVEEARRRGAILAVIRMGDIDLEAPRPQKEKALPTPPPAKQVDPRGRAKERQTDPLAQRLFDAELERNKLRSRAEEMQAQLMEARRELQVLQNLLQKTELELKRANASKNSKSLEKP